MIQRIKHLSKISASDSKNSGFTLVELMLAMGFIAFMLIFIVFAIVQVVNNYNKGLAVKQINQNARTVVEEMARLVRTTNVQAIDTSALANGRVCFGSVSYIWNIKGATTNQYNDGPPHTPVTMVRVNDPAGALCGTPGSLIDQATATQIFTSQVWVQSVNVTVNPNKQIVDLALQLSTSGQNQPTGTDPVLGTVCQGGKVNQFCAIGTFSTTVTTRNGGQ